MQQTKNVQGQCQQCGGPFHFPAEGIGTVINCPHCGQPTELMLARPPDEPTIPRRAIVWTAVTVIILVGGLGGAIYALKRAQSIFIANPQPTVTNTAPARP